MLKGLIKKLFLWFKKFFTTIPMGHNDVYTELNQKSTNFITEFTAKIANHTDIPQLVNNTGGSIYIAASKDIPNFIDFSLLGYEFCIEKEIFATRKQCFFTTYVKVPDRKNYPNMELIPIEGLSILMDYFGNRLLKGVAYQKVENLLIAYINNLFDWIVDLEKS